MDPELNEAAEADTPVDTPTNDPNENADYDVFETSEVKGLLDSLTADSEAGDQLEDEEVEEQVEQIGQQDANASPVEAKTEEEPAARVLTQEEEDAELLKPLSERTQARFKSLIADNNDLRKAHDEVQRLAENITATPEEFASLMTFNRLAGSNNPDDVRAALQMLEQQREALAKRIGVSVPGVDVLADFPDLRQKVDGFEISEGHALEVAQARRMMQAQEQQRQQHAIQTQQQQQTMQQFKNFEVAAAGFFQAKSGEMDYAAREKKMLEYFSAPGRMDDFVRRFEPSQWLHQLQFLYENLAVPVQPQRAPQPIRSRPSTQGQPSSSHMSSEDRILSVMDRMNL